MAKLGLIAAGERERELIPFEIGGNLQPDLGRNLEVPLQPAVAILVPGQVGPAQPVKAIQDPAKPKGADRPGVLIRLSGARRLPDPVQPLRSRAGARRT